MNDYNTRFRLDGKVALVTGAARGLGAEISQALVQMGAKVMLTDVLEKEGEATARQIDATGDQAAFLKHDVTDEAQWQAVIQATIERFGGFDVLVNNAGIEIPSFLADCELSEFRRIMQVNVEGVFLGVKHAIRAMRPGGAAARGGSIVNLSSAGGLIGFPTLAAYCASKGAVRLLSKSAAVECAKFGYDIRVNSVHPGLVKTDMGSNVVRNLVRLGLAPDEAAAESVFLDMHPLGFGQPSDVASAVVYLASNASRWITGTEQVVDGGVTAM